MPEFNDEVHSITHCIDQYFQGIFQGDVSLLEKVFHKDCILSGDVNGVPYYKKLKEYFDIVRERKSPREMNEDFRMKILAIDILNTIAIAKLHVPMLGYNYYDFISLSKINGIWVIVNKMFTNIPVN